MRPAGERDFPSKRDLWLVLLLGAGGIGVLVSVILAAIETGPRVLGTALPVLALVFGFITWLFLDTGYTVTGDAIRIRSGPFRSRIPIARVDEVRPSRNPLSSPALSLDRLAIRGGGRLVALVSPEDRAGFLRALAERDPELALEGEILRRRGRAS